MNNKKLKPCLALFPGQLWSARNGELVLILRIDTYSRDPVLVYRDSGDPYRVGLDGTHSCNDSLDLIEEVI